MLRARDRRLIDRELRRLVAQCLDGIDRVRLGECVDGIGLLIEVLTQRRLSALGVVAINGRKVAAAPWASTATALLALHELLRERERLWVVGHVADILHRR